MHLLLSLLFACSHGAPAPETPVVELDVEPAALPQPGPGQAAAIFAGGCFWCMESDFDALPGVVATTSGYIGGHLPNPTYEDVTRETSGHKEAVHVVYDTAKLSYAQVLDYFWRHIDPTDGGGQFCDRGDSYESAIFALDEAQRAEAEASKAAIDASGKLPKPIVTPVLPATTFYPAEVYHQDFHTKNPARYAPYRYGCGRDARVAELWGS